MKLNSLNDENLYIENIGDVRRYKKKGGQTHRESGPAVEWVSGPYQGSFEWWLNGVFHRIGGNACYNSKNPSWSWHRNGERHRLNAPAKINFADNKKEYYEFNIFIKEESIK